MILRSEFSSRKLILCFQVIVNFNGYTICRCTKSHWEADDAAGVGLNAEHKEQGINRDEWWSKTRVQQAELQHLGTSESMTGGLLVEETLRA